MCRVDITGSEMKDGTSKLFKHPLGLLKGEATFDVLEYDLPKVLADMFFPQISKLYCSQQFELKIKSPAFILRSDKEVKHSYISHKGRDFRKSGHCQRAGV